MNRNQYIKRIALELLFVTFVALRRVLRPRRVAGLLEIVAVIVLTLTVLAVLRPWLRLPEPEYPDVPTALEVWQRTH
jgi:hypothetical protein